MDTSELRGKLERANCSDFLLLTFSKQETKFAQRLLVS